MLSLLLYLPTTILWTCLMGPLTVLFCFPLCPHFLMFLHNFGCELLCGGWVHQSWFYLQLWVRSLLTHMTRCSPRAGAWGFSQTVHAGAHTPLKAWLCPLPQEPLMCSSHRHLLKENLNPHKAPLLVTSAEYLHMSTVSKGLEAASSLNPDHPPAMLPGPQGSLYMYVTCLKTVSIPFLPGDWGQEIVALGSSALQRISLCINCCCNKLSQTGGLK